MADKTTPTKETLSTKPLPVHPHDAAGKGLATCRPRRSSVIEELERISVQYDAQMKALDDLDETRNLQFDEEDFTTVPGHKLIPDYSTNPLAEFDDDDEAADPFTEEAASAFLRQVEILTLQADLKREENGGK